MMIEMTCGIKRKTSKGKYRKYRLTCKSKRRSMSKENIDRKNTCQSRKLNSIFQLEQLKYASFNFYTYELFRFSRTRASMCTRWAQVIVRVSASMCAGWAQISGEGEDVRIVLNFKRCIIQNFNYSARIRENLRSSNFKFDTTVRLVHGSYCMS